MFQSLKVFNQQNPAQLLAHRFIARIWEHGTVTGFYDADIEAIIKETQNLLSKEPAMLKITAPVVVYGDIHGQLADLLRFMKHTKTPKEVQILFLGDYVDRATKSLEVIMLLLSYKILYPDNVKMLRGNHECSKINRIYGFHEEMLRKRNVKMWGDFQKLFAHLPLVAVINQTILCMHGGISEKIDSWSALEKLQKPLNNDYDSPGLVKDLMWSDPASNGSCVEWQFNAERQTSVIFGQGPTLHTCEALDIALIIRAHQVKPKGHEWQFDNRLLTLFTAPNFNGLEGNYGSVAFISEKLRIRILTLKPKLSSAYLAEEKAKLLEMLSKRRDPNSPDPCCSKTGRKDFWGQQSTGGAHVPKRLSSWRRSPETSTQRECSTRTATTQPEKASQIGEIHLTSPIIHAISPSLGYWNTRPECVPLAPLASGAETSSRTASSPPLAFEPVNVSSDISLRLRMVITSPISNSASTATSQETAPTTGTVTTSSNNNGNTRESVSYAPSLENTSLISGPKLSTQEVPKTTAPPITKNADVPVAVNANEEVKEKNPTSHAPDPALKS